MRFKLQGESNLEYTQGALQFAKKWNGVQDFVVDMFTVWLKEPEARGPHAKPNHAWSPPRRGWDRVFLSRRGGFRFDLYFTYSWLVLKAMTYILAKSCYLIYILYIHDLIQ